MKQALDTFEKMDEVRTSQMMYRINTGLEMGIGDEIAVRFRENVSQQQIEAIIHKYGLDMVKTSKIYNLLIVPKGGNALQIANEIQESGLVLFSHPNFVVSAELYQDIPNDTYFSNQFYLHNTSQIFTDGHTGTIDADIDAPEAWTMTKGANSIIIAVIDEGISSDHPDLPNTRQVRLNGSNFADGDPNNPSPTNNQNHGNSSAGIIAATRNNSQGVTGIAPNCRIMPIRIFDSLANGVSSSLVADAIEFAVDNGAQVLSNSWGYSSSNPNYLPVIVQAIQYAVNSGCIVVFAAGNNARHTQGDNGYVSFPSNVNIPGVITVGASDRNDMQSDYSPTSNPGSQNNQIVDITAPSHRAYPPQYYQRFGLVGGIDGETLEVWSIDIFGNTGYNPYPEFIVPGNPDTRSINPSQVGEQLPNVGVNFNAYTGRFGGTSAACPQVAGVAALILSINPDLTTQQVFNIITGAADQVGGYVYTNGRSNELGSGRLNACRAVTQVISTITLISGPSFVCSSGATFEVSNLPDGVSVSWSASPSYYFTTTSGTGSAFLTAWTGGFRKGVGTITATLVTSCDTFNLTKSVWAGTPTAPTAITLLPDDGVCRGPAYYYQVGLLHPYPSYVSSWYWDLQSPGVIIGSRTGSSLKFYYPSGTTPGRYSVAVKAVNPCGDSSYHIEYFDVIDCDRMEMVSFNIYPNPVRDVLNVEITANDAVEINPEAITELRIYDTFLSLKKQLTFSGSTVSVNTGDLPQGVYLMQFVTAEDFLRLTDSNDATKLEALKQRVFWRKFEKIP